MPELKRCPFCGELVGRFEYDLETGICLVACSGCSATIQAEAADSATSKDAAEKAWNRRTSDYKALAQELTTALSDDLIDPCRLCDYEGRRLECEAHPNCADQRRETALAHAKAAGLGVS